MKKMKKMLALTLAVSMVVLQGCNQAGGTDTSKPEGSSTAAEAASKEGDIITLRFSWWGGDSRHQATLKAIEAYEKANPNVKIEAEYGGYEGYFEKLIAQLGGTNEPDIIQVDSPWLFDLAGKGDFFVDFSKQTTVDLSQFDPKFLKDNCEVNGVLLGVPTGVNPECLFINKDLFEKAGVEVKENYTFDDLMDAGQKIGEEEPGAYLLNGNLINKEYILKKYMIQKTGKEWIDGQKRIGFTEEELVDGYKFYLDMIENHVLAPADEAALYNAKSIEDPKWIEGKVGGALEFLSGFDGYQAATSATLVTAQAPLMENAKATGLLVRPSQLLFVSKRSKNQEEALKFVEFMMNDPVGIEALGVSRGIPATEGGRKLLSEKGILNPMLQETADIAIPNAFTPENQYSSNSDIKTAGETVLEKVGYRKLTPEEAANELIEQYEEILSSLE